MQRIDNFTFSGGDIKKQSLIYIIVKSIGIKLLRGGSRKTIYVYDIETEMIHPCFGDTNERDMLGPYTIDQFYDTLLEGMTLASIDCIIPYHEYTTSFHDISVSTSHKVNYVRDYKRILGDLEMRGNIKTQKDELSFMSVTEIKFCFTQKDLGCDGEWYSGDCLGTTLCEDITEKIMKLHTNLKQGFEMIIVNMEEIKKFVTVVENLEKLSNQLLINAFTVMQSLNNETADFLSGLRKKFQLEPSVILETCKNEILTLIKDSEIVSKEIPKFFTAEQEGFKINSECPFLFEVWSGDVYGDAGTLGLSKLYEEINQSNTEITNFASHMAKVFSAKTQ